ncbi:MAG TPA: hypothetical protein VFA15_05090, partial [Nitrososphaera sp.]|nr:hypothetical protein [Nitrososphaera sp.]
HRFLKDDACIVSSIPNVSHGSVRLALMLGQFPYRPMGLLDETHVRFFNRAAIEEMFEQAGYRIEYVGRNRWSMLDSEVGALLPEAARSFVECLQRDPESETYQFIIKATPRQIHEALGEVQVGALQQVNSQCKVNSRQTNLPSVDILVLETSQARIDELTRRYLNTINYPEHLRRFILTSGAAPYIVSTEKLNLESRPYGEHDFRRYRFAGYGALDEEPTNAESTDSAQTAPADKLSLSELSQHLKSELVFVCDANSYPSADALLHLIQAADGLNEQEFVQANAELKIKPSDADLNAPVLLRKNLLVRVLLQDAHEQVPQPLRDLNRRLMRLASCKRCGDAYYFSIGLVEEPDNKGWLDKINEKVRKTLSRL